MIAGSNFTPLRNLHPEPKHEVPKTGSTSSKCVKNSAQECLMQPKRFA